MALTSQISEYDNEWPNRFTAEKARIEAVFGSKAVDIHHVGSTAVPGLAAKPEIDLLVVVSDHETKAMLIRQWHPSDISEERIFQTGIISIVAMLAVFGPTRFMSA
jgi:GrpB-like predicted nucleotidyltransferase (UPF0157 family)